VSEGDERWNRYVCLIDLGRRGWEGGRAGRAGRAGRVEGWKGGRVEGRKGGREVEKENLKPPEEFDRV